MTLLVQFKKLICEFCIIKTQARNMTFQLNKESIYFVSQDSDMIFETNTIIS